MSAVPHLDPESVELHAQGQGAAAEHLASCDTCRQAVHRARARRRLLGALREPELTDAAFARVEQRLFEARIAPSPRAWAWGLGIALAAGLAALVVLRRAPLQGPLAEAPRVAPARVAGVATLTLLEGEVLRERDGSWTRLRATDTLTDGDRVRMLQGGVAFSVGGGRGAALLPGSEAALDRLAQSDVQLTLDHGQVACGVAPLSGGESFVVSAGGRFVRVVGTQFAVAHVDRVLSVDVDHGTVLVSDTAKGPGIRVVGPGSLRVADGRPLSTATVGSLDGAIAAGLKPAWNAAKGATAGAVRLDVGGLPEGSLVLMDAESEGAWRYAPLSRWVEPGAHVLRARVSGEPERISHIALLAGSGPTQLSLPRSAPPPPENPQALAEAVRAAVVSHRADFTYCYEHALKRNPAVEGRLLLTLSVSALGRIEQTVAKSGDGAALPRELSNCLVRSVRGWTLPAGTAATLELPVELTRAPLQ